MQSFQQLLTWLSDNESALSAVSAILVIAGILYGVLRYVLAPVVRRTSKRKVLIEGSQRAPSSLRTPIKVSPETHLSLAVLLFDSLSSNEEDNFLASGITSEVIAQVTMVPNIRVSSRMSSFQYKSGHVDVSKVATELNTNRVLTGSLRHSGNRIRVIAQLTDTESDSEIWAQSYDRQIEDIFDVQQDIARCIVAEVLGEVRFAKTIMAARAPVNKLDAWGLVQKAYYFWFTNFTPQGVLDASEYLRQAIKIDPEYASAKAALAMLLSQQMTVRICDDYDACAGEASKLIDDAYRQAPTDLDVLENAGVVWQNLGERRRAKDALRQATKLAPLNLISRGYLGLLLSFTGTDEGVVEAKNIIRDNLQIAPKHPSRPYWHYFLAVAEQRQGNHEQAIEYAKESLIEQPAWVHNHYLMANSLSQLGDAYGAKSAIDEASGLNPNLTTPLYIDSVVRIVGDKQSAEAFTMGLDSLS